MILTNEAARAVNDLIDEGIEVAVQAYIEHRDEAEQRRRNEYLKFIVHDLRSPLAAIYYAIQLAEKDLEQVPVSERVREVHRAIKRNVERMRGLIVKLLQEEENLKTGTQVQPRLAPVELRPVAQEAVRALASLATASETEVANDVPPDVCARADAELLVRVFQNLLTNAIDYTPRGRVVAGARATDGRVECWVRDNGQGIPPALARTVFEPGVSGTGHGRTGLGLTIVKRLVEAHGGTVDLESREGKGTTVRFSLPAA